MEQLTLEQFEAEAKEQFPNHYFQLQCQSKIVESEKLRHEDGLQNDVYIQQLRFDAMKSELLQLLGMEKKLEPDPILKQKRNWPPSHYSIFPTNEEY